MPETRRIVLIAAGISLLVVVLVPILVCAAMMSGMSGMEMSNDDMAAMSGMAWRAGGVLVLALITGVVLLTLGIRQR